MIDWLKSIEAYHSDGRFVPVALSDKGFLGGPNPDSDGDYWTDGNAIGVRCWSPEGEGFDGWNVRNVA